MGAGDKVAVFAGDMPGGRAVIYRGVPVAHWQAGSRGPQAEITSAATPVSIIQNGFHDISIM